MIRNATTNPVELAVAAAFVSGQINATEVKNYATDLAQTFKIEGVDTAGWQAAIQKWTGAEQTPKWRTEAKELLVANKGVLRGLASQVEAFARIPATVSAHAHPAAMKDWLFQQGIDAQGDKLGPSQVVADEAFLEPGRFPAYPSGTTPLAKMDPGGKRKAKFPVQIDRSALADPNAAALSSAMTSNWKFLQDRGVEGGDNINTLTRHTYNQFGVDQMLQNLEDRDVRDGRILLVTGYETPIEKLLESERIKEVVVADLSEHGASVVAEKYAQHPNARKLKIKVADFSGVDLKAQGKAAEVFAQYAPGEVPAEVTQKYFSSVAGGDHQVPVAFDSGSFDAVHLPFVAGSLHLGPVTQAAAQRSDGYTGYDDFLGPDNLATPEAADAVVATMKHAFDEAKRICKGGGMLVTNVWARPHPNSPDTPIRLSDTPVTTEAFDGLMDGLSHKFSGNPQPGLPHTVGHIFVSTKE